MKESLFVFELIQFIPNKFLNDIETVVVELMRLPAIAERDCQL
jgi:hypothetical protein